MRVSFWLNTVIYTCPVCDEDHTLKFKNVKDIRRIVKIECPNPNCPSRTGKWKEDEES